MSIYQLGVRYVNGVSGVNVALQIALGIDDCHADTCFAFECKGRLCNVSEGEYYLLYGVYFGNWLCRFDLYCSACCYYALL